jgi:DNA-binding CsgD family transcriptional regulator
MQGRIDGIYDKLGCKKRTQISTTLLFGAINGKAALPVEESEALVIADTVNSIPLRTEEEWIYGDELSPKEYHVLFESAQAQMILRGHHPSVAEIATLVAQNHTAKSIADTLLLSESTVNRRIRNLHQSNPRYPNKVAVVHHVVRTGMQKLIDASLQMHDPNLSGIQRRSSTIRILNERRAERMESFGFDTDDKKFTLAGIRGLTHAAMAKRLRVSHNQITYRQAKATAKACAKGRVGLIHRVYGVE